MRASMWLSVLALLIGLAGTAPAQIPTPDDTLLIQASIPYQDQFGSGEAYVYLSDVHDSLTNPVIVVEGFDIGNSMDWDELYTFLNQENMAETLRAEGFDLVVLNFTDATDYVQRNAFVIVELIEEVRASLPPETTVALVGPSMGGLAARYALAYMETNALDHGVRTFISFDAPQRGADIPLGLQYWLEFFSGMSGQADSLLTQLDRPAARQLLVYHHTDPPGSTGVSDPLRAGLLADLAAVGEYPQLPRKVAVANGSGFGANQGFSAGDQIILYEYNSLLVDITGDVWAVPDGASQMIFDGLIDIFPPPADSLETVTVGGTRPYDNAPGGSRPSMAQMAEAGAPFGEIVALHDSHCFVPTVSALDLDTEDLFYDIAHDPDIMSHTPFDTIYYPAENQEHMVITPENAAWFLDEVRGGMTEVAGERTFLGGDESLEQNFPNPFNPLTSIAYTLPADGQVTLLVFDASGRRVKVLVDARQAAGRHVIRWDGRDEEGAVVASGVYFYRLQRDGYSETKRMVMIR